MTESGMDPNQPKSENSSEDPNNPQEVLPENQNLNSLPDGQPSVEEIIVTPLEEEEFQHPLLRGKTMAEIESLVETQAGAISDMNEELNTRFETQPSAPAPAQTEDQPADYGDDFLSPRFQQVEDRLTSALNKTVAPLLDRLDRGAAVDLRSGLRKELKHFTVLEPHIDKLLRDSGQDPSTVTEEHLKMVYHTASGLAHERGINLNKETTQTTPTTQEAPVSIPQHRPSSAPIPQAPGPQRRQLDENEKRLAKEWFPNSQDPEGDYIRGQDAGEDEIVTPGFSQGGGQS